MPNNPPRCTSTAAPPVVTHLWLGTLIVLPAHAYANTGVIALQVAIPTGFAAPLFPAAGIALSALLIFGIRAWPGVFLSSLITQTIGGIRGSHATGLFAGTMLIPVGATLQALG